MGGFEGADHVNGHGIALDMAASNGHAWCHEQDYAQAAGLGLLSLRESIGWRLAEPRPQHYRLARAVAMAQAAQRQGVQLIWTLWHYGMPDDLGPWDDALVPRFAAFAGAVARALAPHSASPPVYIPINEIGFLAWALSATGMMKVHGSAPADELDLARNGYAVKRRLVRAALAAMAAIREADPRARFLHVEPVVHVVAPDGRPELAAQADELAAHQWQAWDLLAGRDDPALGGSEAMLDLIGVNHYHSSQWELVSQRRLDWAGGDTRRRPPSLLLEAVWQRYGRPVLIAETSHVGEGRAQWLEQMTHEVALARARGVPVAGLCLYPLVDRPDWDGSGRWHRSGLFDVVPPQGPLPVLPQDDGAACEAPAVWPRFLDPFYAASLTRCAHRLLDSQPKESLMKTLLVFCHLRWGFVYQRPQHLLSRLARSYRVVFVEEPLPGLGDGETPRLEVSHPAPGVEVLCPRTGVPTPGFHDDHLSVLHPLLADHLRREGIHEALVWFYTPMALPLLDVVEPLGVVYDCMDELSAFKGAPRQLRQRETALMRSADVVLTGGPSLYEARRSLREGVHCVPSAVDAAHFSPRRLLPASREAQAANALHAGIPGPRLGFYGVIDERLDTALLAGLADARPDWQWVMVGPVVKIDPAELPRRPNLHWLGMQTYAVLPYLLAAWDVALLPFALNEATRFISPTKTLEYLAGHKPVVSTAVHDVEVLYGDMVAVAHDPAAFLARCDEALSLTPAERAERAVATDAAVRQMSWDSAVANVEDLLSALPQVARTATPDAEPAPVFGT